MVIKTEVKGQELNKILSKLSDFFVKILLNQSILKKCNHLISVIPACRESFLKLRKDSGQARMTELRIAQFGY